MTMYQDNKSVIMMSTEYTNDTKSKHILTKLTYIRSVQRSGAVDIEYLNTEDMTADVLSKALHGYLFNKHVTSMMGLRYRSMFKSSQVVKKKRSRRDRGREGALRRARLQADKDKV